MNLRLHVACGLLTIVLSACQVGAPRVGVGSDSSTPTEAAEIPAWFQAHMRSMIGRWVADNAEYVGEQEPFERYATEWRWGVGETSLVGELYGLRTGKADVKLWEYRAYWHPGYRKARLDQWGRGGALLAGVIQPDGETESGAIFEVEQVWYSTSGDRLRTRHRTVHGEKLQVSDTFRWEGGRWVEDRHYEWHRLGPGPGEVQKPSRKKPGIST